MLYSQCNIALEKVVQCHPWAQTEELTWFHASFFPFWPLAGHPSSSPFLGTFSPFSPSRKVCRARGTAKSLERANFRMDLSTKFGKEISSRSLRESRSENHYRLHNPLRDINYLPRIKAARRISLHKRMHSQNGPTRTQYFVMMAGLMVDMSLNTVELNMGVWIWSGKTGARYIAILRMPISWNAVFHGVWGEKQSCFEKC